MVNESISEDSDIYRKLQKHLDQMPIGFPRAESGSDIRLLKHLFTLEEAKIAIFLNFGWYRDIEPLDQIYGRIKNIIWQKKDPSCLKEKEKGNFMVLQH